MVVATSAASSSMFAGPAELRLRGEGKRPQMGTGLSGRSRHLQRWLLWAQPCEATFAENPLQPGKGLRPGNAHVGEDVVIPSAFQKDW